MSTDMGTNCEGHWAAFFSDSTGMLSCSENKGCDSYITLEESGGHPGRGPSQNVRFFLSVFFSSTSIMCCLVQNTSGRDFHGEPTIRWMVSFKQKPNAYASIVEKNASILCKTLGAHLHFIFSDVLSRVLYCRPRAEHDRKMLLALNSLNACVCFACAYAVHSEKSAGCLASGHRRGSRFNISVEQHRTRSQLNGILAREYQREPL